MLKNRCCEKNIDTDFAHTLIDYPHAGAKTFLRESACPLCYLPSFVFRYEYNYGRSTELTNWFRATPKKREEFLEVLRVGRCKVLTKDERKSDKKNKHKTPEVLTGVYTLIIKQGNIDFVSRYLKRVAKAEQIHS